MSKAQFNQAVLTALSEIEVGVEDAKGDFPDVNEDDLYHEIAQGVLLSYPYEVRKEVRFRLGFDWRE
jgi:hypothetical protein